MILDWSDYIWIGVIAAMVIYGLWWKNEFDLED